MGNFRKDHKMVSLSTLFTQVILYVAKQSYKVCCLPQFGDVTAVSGGKNNCSPQW